MNAWWDAIVQQIDEGFVGVFDGVDGHGVDGVANHRRALGLSADRRGQQDADEDAEHWSNFHTDLRGRGSDEPAVGNANDDRPGWASTGKRAARNPAPAVFTPRLWQGPG